MNPEEEEKQHEENNRKMLEMLKQEGFCEDEQE